MQSIYIWTTDSHELFGPFMGRLAAHSFAEKRQMRSYHLTPTPTNYMRQSFRPSGEVFEEMN